MALPRLTAEEKGTKVFDFLSATDRADIHQIVRGTGLKRPAINGAVRWLRDTLGAEALVCNVDGTYELAMTSTTVADYRKRRQARMANEMERLNKVIRASITKFGAESDPVLASELIKTAISLLRRGSGTTTDDGRMAERVR
jgi:hypothetical protein